MRPVPRSLQNIYKELHDDLGIPPAAARRSHARGRRTGVMLLNRVLTVQAGVSGSHRGKGWEAVTDAAIRALVARGGPLVAILWGRDAASLKPMLGDTPTISVRAPEPALGAQRILRLAARSAAQTSCSSRRAAHPSTGALD